MSFVDQGSRSIRWLTVCVELLALSTSVLLAACGSTKLPPGTPWSFACRPDSRLAGTWKSYRTSQLGPAWMTFRLACDCTYRSTASTLFIRIGERGRYQVRDRRIRFVRPAPRGGTQETVWPFELDGDTLRLEEYEGETNTYRRTHRESCRP